MALGGIGKTSPAPVYTDPKIAAKNKKEKEKAAAKELEKKVFAYQPQQLQAGALGRLEAPSALAPQLAGNLNVASGDIGFLRGFAQSKGPSEQAGYLTEGQKLEEQAGLQNLSRDQAIRQSQAFSNLAQQGGAESGARERLAQSGARQGLTEAQALRQQGAMARLGILSDDEGRKLNVAGALPGQQLNLAQEQRIGLEGDRTAKMAIDQANMDALQKEQMANLGIQQDIFGQRAGIYGGDKLAAAQKKAANSGGGGFLSSLGL